MAGFKSECTAGFVGIRTLPQRPQSISVMPMAYSLVSWVATKPWIGRPIVSAAGNTEAMAATAYPSGEDRGLIAARRLRISGVGLSGGLCDWVVVLRRDPVPGHQFLDPVDRMAGDAREDVGEPSLRIDIVHFCRRDQAVHHCGPLSTAVGTGEQP